MACLGFSGHFEIWNVLLSQVILKNQNALVKSFWNAEITHLVISSYKKKANLKVHKLKGGLILWNPYINSKPKSLKLESMKPKSLNIERSNTWWTEI